MFFGKGDTSKLDPTEIETLRQLERMVETGHIVGLDARQSQIALRAIQFYADWEGAVRLGAHIRNIFVLIAGGLGFWWITGGQNFISDFVRSLGGSP